MKNEIILLPIGTKNEIIFRIPPIGSKNEIILLLLLVQRMLNIRYGAMCLPPFPLSRPTLIPAGKSSGPGKYLNIGYNFFIISGRGKL